jgi:hypothetical protein
MGKKAAQKLDEILRDQLKELVDNYVPSFGNQHDIAIRDNLEKLNLKGLSIAQRNSIMAQTVYLLKQYGKFKENKDGSDMPAGGNLPNGDL